MLLGAEAPSEQSGVSAKGRAYKFCSRRLQVFTGKVTVVCSETRDRIEEFQPLRVGQVVSYDIAAARMDGSQLVLRIANN